MPKLNAITRKNIYGCKIIRKLYVNCLYCKLMINSNYLRLINNCI